MKLIPVILLALLSATALGEPPTASQPSESIGRYQIVVGKVDSLAQNLPTTNNVTGLSDATLNTVVKIDTVTGQTWLLKKAVNLPTPSGKTATYTPGFFWEELPGK